MSITPRSVGVAVMPEVHGRCRCAPAAVFILIHINGGIQINLFLKAAVSDPGMVCKHDRFARLCQNTLFGRRSIPVGGRGISADANGITIAAGPGVSCGLIPVIHQRITLANI